MISAREWERDREIDECVCATDGNRRRRKLHTARGNCRSFIIFIVKLTCTAYYVYLDVVDSVFVGRTTASRPVVAIQSSHTRRRIAKISAMQKIRWCVRMRLRVSVHVKPIRLSRALRAFNSFHCSKCNCEWCRQTEWLNSKIRSIK